MIRLVLSLFLLAALCVPAHAHRQPEVETTVRRIDATASPVLGITHRLHAHDALRLLRVLGEASPDLDDADQLARLAVYASGAILWTGEAASIPLGAEVEGNFVFVYVQHPAIDTIEGATFLDGAIPGWTNTVHIQDESGQTAQSVTFSADRPRLERGAPPLDAGKVDTTDDRQSTPAN